MPLASDHTDLLAEGVRRLGLALPVETLAQLSVYLEELLFWSVKIDLVSQTDPAEIIRKHLLDSLAATPHLRENGALLDLGSGAGFPGIPLAIALPRNSVSLVEARRKRANFLREVARKVKAANLAVYEGRAEALATEKTLRGAFDVVITRATWDIPVFLQHAHPFLRDAGVAVAMRGRDSETEDLSAEILEGFRLLKTHCYTLPFGQERRRLLFFSKNVSRAT